MKAASISEIKNELKDVSPVDLVELCLRLARHKKENKELLTYLLFEAHDMEQFIKNIKEEMDNSFSQINLSNVYFAKKSLRKILRTANKFIRFAANKATEVELLLHYCTNFKGLNKVWNKSTALTNLYNSQLKKIESSIAVMHEDLQHDYLKELRRLEI
jgi:gas vesicle protein